MQKAKKMIFIIFHADIPPIQIPQLSFNFIGHIIHLRTSIYPESNQRSQKLLSDRHFLNNYLQNQDHLQACWVALRGKGYLFPIRPEAYPDQALICPLVFLLLHLTSSYQITPKSPAATPTPSWLNVSGLKSKKADNQPL